MSTETGQPLLTKAPAYRWWILVMNLLMYSVYYIALNAAAAFGAQIQDSWHLNATALSMMTTVAQLSYVLFCGVGSSLANRIGAKKCVLVSAALLLVSSAVYPLIAKNYVVGLVLRVLQGASGGLMSSCIVSTTSLWFPIKQRGLASGILFACIGFGFSITVAGGNLLLGLGLNWTKSLAMLICVPGVIVTALYAFTVKNVSDVYPGHYAIADLMPPEPESAGGIRVDTEKLPGTMAAARKDKKVWALALTGFVNSWMILGFSAFLSHLLVYDLKVDSGLVATVMSLTFLVGAAGSILGGVISDRVFKGYRYQTLMIGGILAAVGLLLLLVTRNNVFIIVFLILAYLGPNIVMGPVWACPASLVKPQIAGSVTAFANVIANIGGLIVSPILGLTIDATGSAMMALFFCVAMSILGTITARIMKV